MFIELQDVPIVIEDLEAKNKVRNNKKSSVSAYVNNLVVHVFVDADARQSDETSTQQCGTCLPHP